MFMIHEKVIDLKKDYTTILKCNDDFEEKYILKQKMNSSDQLEGLRNQFTLNFISWKDLQKMKIFCFLKSRGSEYRQVVGN